MDVQNGIVERFPGEGLLDRLASAVASARAREIPVIFVRVAFRPGAPEVAAGNRMFARMRGAVAPAGSTDLHPALGAAEDDLVVVKKRVSAFAGSDLEVLLRGLGVDHLVLAGIATSGVVLSTVREAADKDFRLTVLSDGCADADEEVHRVLLEKVFPRQASVMTVAEWAAAG